MALSTEKLSLDDFVANAMNKYNTTPAPAAYEPPESMLPVVEELVMIKCY